MSKKRRIGDILKEKLEVYLKSFTNQQGSPLQSLFQRGVSGLIDGGYITPEFGNKALSQQHALPSADLLHSKRVINGEIQNDLISVFSRNCLLAKQFLPLKYERGTLEIVVADPVDKAKKKEIEEIANWVFKRDFYRRRKNININYFICHISGIRKCIEVMCC